MGRHARASPSTLYSNRTVPSDLQNVGRPGSRTSQTLSRYGRRRSGSLTGSAWVALVLEPTTGVAGQPMFAGLNAALLPLIKAIETE